jgi:crotonobetainyl-CoA:carnitine CoA-transferase CaiB-like acyl-CoA transferase
MVERPAFAGNAGGNASREVRTMSALAGLRVLDLSSNRTGAQATQLFSDFGAEVVWVEPPGGSLLRQHPAFPFWARGKQSIEIDLRSEAGPARVRELAESADVLVETYRPGVLGRRGLGYAALSADNPGLVYTSITGYGSQGPYADAKGYEALVAAKLGLMQSFARAMPDGRPPFLAVPWFSFAASQTALHGTLAALVERESSGIGQHVEASLLQGFSGIDTWSWFERLIDEKWPGAYERAENFDANGVPNGAFPYLLLVALTKDGHWLQFAQVAPRLFQALIKALELEFLFTDPEWKGFPILDDAERRSKVWSLMLEAARKKTLAQWQEVFERDPNVFAEIFRVGTNVLEHPQLVESAMVVDIEDEERGAVRQLGPLIEMTRTPAALGRSAPRLDAHDLDEFDSSGAAARAATHGAPNGAPLEGVTILEIAGLFAAPYGATLLADLGARIIKIEPLEGDPIRTILPFPEVGGAKVMQGKESICIDITSPDGLALVHQLVAQSDLIMQGFRAGVAERLGLGYERLREVNPDLVYLNAQGYGDSGPDGHRPAYAPSFAAAVGIARTAVAGNVREGAGLDIDEVRASAKLLTIGGTLANAQADGFAAQGVATALLLGLFARQRGLGGQEISATMLNTSAHAMSAQIIDYPGSLGEPAPGADLRGLSALYRSYDSSDGWIFLAAPQEHEWRAFIRAIAPRLAGRIDLASDARFATPEARKENDSALGEILSEMFRERGKDAWEKELRAADVGCVAVHTGSIEEMMWNEDFGRASGYIKDVVHPTFDAHPRLAPLVRFSRSATKADPGILAGEHTDSILGELGCTSEAITELRQKKVVC